jgi:hypothetical protein
MRYRERGLVSHSLIPNISNKYLLITVGAPIAGRISDQIVMRCRTGRGGKWYPEDRLKATLFGAFILVPLSVFFSGLLTAYVPGKLGLVLNLISLFLNGIGVSCSLCSSSTYFMALVLQVDFVLSPSAAYFVDLMHARSAEAMAANK